MYPFALTLISVLLSFYINFYFLLVIIFAFIFSFSYSIFEIKKGDKSVLLRNLTCLGINKILFNYNSIINYWSDIVFFLDNNNEKYYELTEDMDIDTVPLLIRDSDNNKRIDISFSEKQNNKIISVIKTIFSAEIIESHKPYWKQ